MSRFPRTTAVLFTIAVLFAAACGAQLSGSVTEHTTSDGKADVAVCLDVIAANAPEHLSSTGLALARRKGAPVVASSTPSAGSAAPRVE